MSWLVQNRKSFRCWWSVILVAGGREAYQILVVSDLGCWREGNTSDVGGR